VTVAYVDTGNMAANHAWNTGFELLWSQGPYSVLGEFVSSSVRSQTSGNPNFCGYCVTGSQASTARTTRSGLCPARHADRALGRGGTGCPLRARPP
jgi:hypothetical protein